MHRAGEGGRLFRLGSVADDVAAFVLFLLRGACRPDTPASRHAAMLPRSEHQRSFPSSIEQNCISMSIILTSVHRDLVTPFLPRTSYEFRVGSIRLISFVEVDDPPLLRKSVVAWTVLLALPCYRWCSCPVLAEGMAFSSSSSFKVGSH